MKILSNKLKSDGYLPIKIPNALINRVKQSVLSDIKFKLKIKKETSLNFNNIKNLLLKLDDEKFNSLFGNYAQRQLSDKTPSLFNDWVSKNIKKITKDKQCCINYVNKNDLKINPKLSKYQNMTYYRLVRQSKKNDVGFLHRDCDFWSIDNLDKKIKGEFLAKKRWKIWLPLWGVNESNVLRMFKKSHTKKIKTKFLVKNGSIKPKIDTEQLKKLKLKDLISIKNRKKYNAVLFHDKLVHYAPPNSSSKIRSSFEFTIFAR